MRALYCTAVLFCLPVFAGVSAITQDATSAMPGDPKEPLLSEGGVQIAGGVPNGNLIEHVAPFYPPIAKAARVQGTVVLDEIINKDGKVTNLRVISGPAMLQTAALEAVKQWRYKPYLVNGEPVEIETTANVIFTLDTGAAPSEDQGSATPKVIFAPGVVEGSLVQKVAPIYPVEAKQAGISGMVRLHGVIDREGGLKNLRVLSGPPLLQDAALDAARQWRYKPYTLNGNPVEVETTINVNFTLDKSASASQADGTTPPTAGAGSRPEIVNVSGGISQGNLVQKVAPLYPTEAKLAGVSGTVVLQAEIGLDGRVEDLNVISGPDLLQQAALDAVKQWLYKPYLLNGEPIKVRTTINVIFTLGR